jgi:acetyl esterase/lipase
MELLQMPVPPGAQRIAYGAEPLQFGELRVPEGKGPHPVAVIVHGGCWVNALPGLDERATSIDLMRPMAAALAREGIATWNIEYRRLGNAGGGWPGSFRDVAQASDHLRKLAKSNALDLNRVVAIGHSAGGSFALWLAGRHKLAKSSDLYSADPLKLKGAVNLDGPGDLAAAAPMAPAICGAPVITQLMGGSPQEQPQRYKAGSPVEMLPLGVPQAVFAGAMFASQASPYAGAGRQAGDEVRTTVIEKGGHFTFIDPDSKVWPGVAEAVKSLLGGNR